MKTIVSSSAPTSKRLLFDRRYGYVIDDWKAPSEEALSGSRGMFCIVPLAKALLKTTSQSINVAASSAVKALEKPELFLPQGLQVNLSNELRKIRDFGGTIFQKRNVYSNDDARLNSEAQMGKQ